MNNKFKNLYKEFEPVNLIELMKKESVVLKKMYPDDENKLSLLNSVLNKQHRNNIKQNLNQKYIYIQPPEINNQDYIKIYAPKFKHVRIIKP